MQLRQHVLEGLLDLLSHRLQIYFNNYFKNSLNFSKNYRKRLVLWKLQDRPFRVLPSETCYTADDASSILHLSSHSFELLVTVWLLCGRRDGRNPNLKYQKLGIFWKISQWKFRTCNCHTFIRINEETSKWNWSCNRWVNNRHEKSNDGDICVDVHTVIEVSWVSNKSKWTVPQSTSTKSIGRTYRNQNFSSCDLMPIVLKTMSCLKV